MKSDKIEEGKIYEVKVGKNTTTMRVMKVERRVNGQVVFDCMNTKTNKRATVSDEKRFVKEIKGSILQNAVETVKAILPKGKEKKAENPVAKTETTDDKTKRTREPRADGTVSGLEAALIVLRESGEPMNIKAIMEKINERGLAKLNGKTPSATVSAAIQMEIKRKQENSRFEKAGKGLFVAR